MKKIMSLVLSPHFFLIVAIITIIGIIITSPENIFEHRTISQLDRIEQKLDKLIEANEK